MARYEVVILSEDEDIPAKSTKVVNTFESEYEDLHVADPYSDERITFSVGSNQAIRKVIEDTKNIDF